MHNNQNGALYVCDHLGAPARNISLERWSPVYPNISHSPVNVQVPYSTSPIKVIPQNIIPLPSNEYPMRAAHPPFFPTNATPMPITHLHASSHPPTSPVNIPTNMKGVNHSFISTQMPLPSSPALTPLNISASSHTPVPLYQALPQYYSPKVFPSSTNYSREVSQSNPIAQGQASPRANFSNSVSQNDSLSFSIKPVLLENNSSDAIGGMAKEAAKPSVAASLTPKNIEKEITPKTQEVKNINPKEVTERLASFVKSASMLKEGDGDNNITLASSIPSYYSVPSYGSVEKPKTPLTHEKDSSLITPLSLQEIASAASTSQERKKSFNESDKVVSRKSFMNSTVSSRASQEVKRDVSPSNASIKALSKKKPNEVLEGGRQRAATPTFARERSKTPPATNKNPGALSTPIKLRLTKNEPLVTENAKKPLTASQGSIKSAMGNSIGTKESTVRKKVEGKDRLGSPSFYTGRNEEASIELKTIEDAEFFSSDNSQKKKEKRPSTARVQISSPSAKTTRKSGTAASLALQHSIVSPATTQRVTKNTMGPVAVRKNQTATTSKRTPTTPITQKYSSQQGYKNPQSASIYHAKSPLTLTNSCKSFSQAPTPANIAKSKMNLSCWEEKYDSWIKRKKKVQEDCEKEKEIMEEEKKKEEIESCTFKPNIISKKVYQLRYDNTCKNAYELLKVLCEKQSKLFSEYHQLIQQEDREQHAEKNIDKIIYQNKVFKEALEKAIQQNTLSVNEWLTTEEGKNAMESRSKLYIEYNPGISAERATQEAETDIKQNNLLYVKTTFIKKVREKYSQRIKELNVNKLNLLYCIKNLETKLLQVANQFHQSLSVKDGEGLGEGGMEEANNDDTESLDSFVNADTTSILLTNKHIKKIFRFAAHGKKLNNSPTLYFYVGLSEQIKSNDRYKINETTPYYKTE